MNNNVAFQPSINNDFQGNPYLSHPQQLNKQTGHPQHQRVQQSVRPQSQRGTQNMAEQSQQVNNNLGQLQKVTDSKEKAKSYLLILSRFSKALGVIALIAVIASVMAWLHLHAMENYRGGPHSMMKHSESFEFHMDFKILQKSAALACIIWTLVFITAYQGYKASKSSELSQITQKSKRTIILIFVITLFALYKLNFDFKFADKMVPPPPPSHQESREQQDQYKQYQPQDDDSGKDQNFNVSQNKGRALEAKDNIWQKTKTAFKNKQTNQDQSSSQVEDPSTMLYQNEDIDLEDEIIDQQQEIIPEETELPDLVQSIDEMLLSLEINEDEMDEARRRQRRDRNRSQWKNNQNRRRRHHQDDQEEEDENFEDRNSFEGEQRQWRKRFQDEEENMDEREHFENERKSPERYHDWKAGFKGQRHHERSREQGERRWGKRCHFQGNESDQQMNEMEAENQEAGSGQVHKMDKHLLRREVKKIKICATVSTFVCLTILAVYMYFFNNYKKSVEQYFEQRQTYLAANLNFQQPSQQLQPPQAPQDQVFQGQQVNYQYQLPQQQNQEEFKENDNSYNSSINDSLNTEQDLLPKKKSAKVYTIEEVQEMLDQQKFMLQQQFQLYQRPQVFVPQQHIFIPQNPPMSNLVAPQNSFNQQRQSSLVEEGNIAPSTTNVNSVM